MLGPWFSPVSSETKYTEGPKAGNETLMGRVPAAFRASDFARNLSTRAWVAAWAALVSNCCRISTCGTRPDKDDFSSSNHVRAPSRFSAEENGLAYVCVRNEPGSSATLNHSG